MVIFSIFERKAKTTLHVFLFYLRLGGWSDSGKIDSDSISPFLASEEESCILSSASMSCIFAGLHWNNPFLLTGINVKNVSVEESGGVHRCSIFRYGANLCCSCQFLWILCTRHVCTASNILRATSPGRTSFRQICSSAYSRNLQSQIEPAQNNTTPEMQHSHHQEDNFTVYYLEFDLVFGENKYQ